MKNKKVNYTDLLHGADYNPEQWIDYPEVLEKDIELMKQANCNVMSVGMFSWSMLEPTEGEYNLEWLENIINKMYENGIYTILSTPSAARPTWLAQKYPEVLRVEKNRVRNLFGARHNHCYTSPAYREKIARINGKLAERFADNPAVLMWHVSNEYGGECHCPLCQAEFRKWLKEKYNTLDNINKAWWTTFWSHRYTDWEQIESPAPHGEMGVHGLNLDWKRFVTDRTIDFMNHEVASVKQYTPNLPISINMMYYYDGLNYFKFKDHIDIVSWDSYPVWHKKEDKDIGIDTAMFHDIMRSIKKQPFLLMESAPSSTNWQSVSKLKKPGMHKLSSLQAVAHGSNSVQYFQWRKSRGSSEKLHGAVVDHYGESDTRVFQDVKEVGQCLKDISELCHSEIKSEVAILFDWENMWAINDSQGPRNIGMKYKETVQSHYKAFWEMGIPVDFVDMECKLSGYKLLVAPMLYMLRAGIEEKIKKFVQDGGMLVTTYWSGIVNETDLCFLGGFPGPLKEVLGIWSEEIDGLYDHDSNEISFIGGNELGLTGSFEVKELCDLIHLQGATELARYQEDFYKGRPALTVNQFGQGKAYYIAARANDEFHKDLYKKLVKEAKISYIIDTDLPEGVTAQQRTLGGIQYVFVMNFTPEEKTVCLDDREYIDASSEKKVDRNMTIRPYGINIIKRNN